MSDDPRCAMPMCDALTCERHGPEARATAYIAEANGYLRIARDENAALRALVQHAEWARNSCCDACCPWCGGGEKECHFVACPAAKVMDWKMAGP